MHEPVWWQADGRNMAVTRGLLHYLYSKCRCSPVQPCLGVHHEGQPATSGRRKGSIAFQLVSRYVGLPRETSRQLPSQTFSDHGGLGLGATKLWARPPTESPIPFL